MKLRELLTAGAAAIAFASVASANDLEGSLNATNFPNTGAAADAPLLIASEATAPVNNAALILTLAPSGANTYLNSNQIIEVDFAGATLDGALTVNAASCDSTGNFSVIAGGGVGDTSVRILADNISGCTAGNPIQFDAVVDIANGVDASATASVVTEGSNTAVGGGSASLPMVAWTESISIAFNQNSTPVAQLSTFNAFQIGGANNWFQMVITDNSAGGVGAVTAIHDVALTGLADLATIATGNLDIEVDGDFAGFNTAAGATNAGRTQFTATQVPAGGPPAVHTAGATQYTVTALGGANSINGGTYAASAELATAAGYADKAASASLEIDRQGTDFTFSYTLDDTLVQSFPGTIVSYRIANNTGSAAGPVTVQLRSWDNAPTTTGIVQLASSIPANGDLTFSPADIEALVGAYGVGDFVVNVEAAAANLEASYTQVSNGGVTNLDVR